MTTDYNTAIDNAATQPKQVSVDGTSVVAQDIDSLIKAADRSASKNAAKRNHFGLRMAKIEPPGGG